MSSRLVCQCDREAIAISPMCTIRLVPAREKLLQ
jgi:hypothetical protein